MASAARGYSPSPTACSSSSVTWSRSRSGRRVGYGARVGDGVGVRAKVRVSDRVGVRAKVRVSDRVGVRAKVRVSDRVGVELRVRVGGLGLERVVGHRQRIGGLPAEHTRRQPRPSWGWGQGQG